MPDDAYILKWLHSHCDGALLERVQFVSAQTEEVPLHRGVLFLMAFWSGTAHLGHKNVCRVFAEIGLPEDFVFRIVDIDGLSPSLASTLFQYPVGTGGNAEAYWYRDGQIIATTHVATATDERIREIFGEIYRD